MLKNILNLKGTQVLTSSELKSQVGGASNCPKIGCPRGTVCRVTKNGAECVLLSTANAGQL